MNRKKDKVLNLFLLILLLVFAVEFYIFIQDTCKNDFRIKNIMEDARNKSKTIQLNEDIIDFEGFDNINGVNRPIVPNIVHLLYLQQPYIKFYQLVNILTIYYNHGPDHIYFHCDDCNFKGKIIEIITINPEIYLNLKIKKKQGKYFDILRNYKPIWKLIKFYKIPFKKTIFGVSYGFIFIFVRIFK